MLERMTVVLSNCCNSKCRDCYTRTISESDMVMDWETIRLLKNIREKYGNPRHLIISGGEPTLHLAKLEELLKNPEGIHTKIISNGWWGGCASAAEKMISLMSSVKLSTLEISCGTEHQRHIDIDAVKNAINLTLLNKCAREIIVAYEIFEPQEIKNVKRIFSDLAKSNSVKLKILVSYWNRLRGNNRTDGRGHSYNITDDWCELLHGTNITVKFNGDIYRCCGGMIMDEGYPYKIGNILDSEFVFPMSNQDKYLGTFSTLQKTGRRLNAELCALFPEYERLFKCIRCKLMLDKMKAGKKADRVFLESRGQYESYTIA